MRKVIVCGLCIVLLALYGCGRKTEKQALEKVMEKAIEDKSGGKAEVDIQGETMTIKTEDGVATFAGGKDAKLPPDFPADIYIYEGAKIMACMQSAGGTTVSFTCKDAPAKVASVYRVKMKEKGWGLEQALDMGAQHIVMLNKGEHKLVVSIGENSGETFVALALEKKE